MPRPSFADQKLLEAVAGRLRKARQHRDWTQEQLAEALGLQPETISRYEGATIPLSLTQLFRIADVLDVGVDALLNLPRQNSGGGDEDELVERWRLLDKDARELVVGLVRRLGGR